MKFNEWAIMQEFQNERERDIAYRAWNEAIRFRSMESVPSHYIEKSVLLMSASGNIEECHQSSNGEWYGCSSRIHYKNAQGWMSAPNNAQFTT